MTSPLPPPGWYPDSTVSGQQRYWDGRAWTEHTAPAGPNGPTPSPSTQDSAAAGAEENGAMRDETIDAIAVWCGSLEAAVAEQNTLPNTGPAVQQALLGLGELAAAVVLVSVDASPDWVGKPVLVESAVSTLFETMTEEGLAEGAAKSVADQKAKYYQNLVSSPEITASAKKYGLPPETVARDLADDFVEQMTQAIRSVTPLVLRVAKEPWSVAALEERLAAATAGTGRRGSAVTAVDEPAPAAPGRSAAAWYADPSGRHQYRYWDGTRWTPHVANNGETSVDPLDSAPDKEALQT